MAFRYDVGTDYFYNYIPSFSRILNGTKLFSNEHGFYMLYKFLQLFTLQSQSIIILTSFIYVFFLIWAVDENSSNPIISIITLFLMTLFFIALNNIRQQTAAIIMLWGFRYIKKRNFAAYLSTTIVAMYFFHQTAIFLLLLYPLFNVKLFQKYCYIWMIGGLFLIPILAELFYVILKLFGYNYGDNPGFEAVHGNYDLLLINSVVFLLLLISYRKKIIKDRITYGLFSIQYFAFIVSILSIRWSMLEIPDRVTYYFMMYQVLSIPLAIVTLFKECKYGAILTSTVFLWIGTRAFYTLIVEQGYHEVLPYQFVFDHWDELKVEKPEKNIKCTFGGNYELSYTYSSNYGKDE